MDEEERQMTAEGLIIILIVGAIAGWLAGTVVRGRGFGLIGDIVVGILGAFLASWLLPRLGVGSLGLGGGWIGSILFAFIGAVILLLLVRLIRRI
jgi:uncharacterized membrane protein YeaQ/YmgE (transglycosylase-associated protein family)